MRSQSSEAGWDNLPLLSQAEELLPRGGRVNRVRRTRLGYIKVWTSGIGSGLQRPPRRPRQDGIVSLPREGDGRRAAGTGDQFTRAENFCRIKVG